jgi:hypothetical protein
MACKVALISKSHAAAISDSGNCVLRSINSKKPPKSRILILVGLFNHPPIVEISALLWQ